MKKIILFFILLQSFNSAFAQVDRSIAPNQYNRTSKKGEKKDPLEITLNYLKDKLSLDSFQEAAVKVYLNENSLEAQKIIASNLSKEEKKEKLDIASDTFDLKLKEILSPDQIKSFEELKEKNKPKDKKKKKKKEKEEN